MCARLKGCALRYPEQEAFSRKIPWPPLFSDPLVRYSRTRMRTTYMDNFALFSDTTALKWTRSKGHGHELVRFLRYCPLYTMEETRSLPSRPSWWDRWISQPPDLRLFILTFSFFAVLHRLSKGVKRSRYKNNKNNKACSRNFERFNEDVRRNWGLTTGVLVTSIADRGQ